METEDDLTMRRINIHALLGLHDDKREKYYDLQKFTSEKDGKLFEDEKAKESKNHWS